MEAPGEDLLLLLLFFFLLPFAASRSLSHSLAQGPSLRRQGQRAGVLSEGSASHGFRGHMAFSGLPAPPRSAGTLVTTLAQDRTLLSRSFP